METKNASPTKSTLFVAELPHGLGEPEFVGIFKDYEGFIDARLTRDRKDNTVGFVDFSYHEAANAAMDALQGYKFDYKAEHGMSIQFSRPTGGNNRPRRPRRRDGPEDYGGGQSFGSQSGYYRGLPVMSNPADVPFAPYGGFAGPAYNNIYPPLPPDASSTLYVEGLPIDATEREVSHIFRLYPGYQSVRIMAKETKTFPQRTYNLCFVEFSSKYNAMMALQGAQGYPMELNDTKGLAISFAKAPTKSEGRGRGGRTSTRSSGLSDSSPPPQSSPLPHETQ